MGGRAPGVPPPDPPMRCFVFSRMTLRMGVNEALSFSDADIQMLSRDMLSAGRLFLCCNKILIQKLFQWRIYIVKF